MQICRWPETTLRTCGVFAMQWQLLLFMNLLNKRYLPWLIFFRVLCPNNPLSFLYNIYKCEKTLIKWKHFPRYWPSVWGINLSLVSSPHKGQWRGDLMFSLICAWINDWVNNRDLRRHRVHYDVTVTQREMLCHSSQKSCSHRMVNSSAYNTAHVRYNFHRGKCRFRI